MSDIEVSNGHDLKGAVPNAVVSNAVVPDLLTIPDDYKIDVGLLKQRVYCQLLLALNHLFPLGKVDRYHAQFLIGNVQGDAGESLKVELTGPKIGLWHDFATEEGGDILSLWAAAKGFDIHHQFLEVIASVQEWLGTPMLVASLAQSSRPQPSFEDLFPSQSTPSKKLPVNDLGNPTMTWTYQDAEGNSIAHVSRYDTETGKTFRPFDVTTHSYKTPNPRPLYNQPGMAQSETVVIVEGEKCAQTLIDWGICATTAMNGAKAPLDKTDWSPLEGKHVIIWPDHDKVGMDYADRLGAKLKTLHDNGGIASLSRVVVPEDKPDSWDAADAHEEGVDIEAFLKAQSQLFVKPVLDPAPQEDSFQKKRTLLASKVSQMLADPSVPPADLIGPRILTPGGLLVMGGAPKVGKTDMMLSWLMHMAAGLPFLGMTPPRPLKIFYLQTEIMYPYLKERVEALGFDPAYLPLVGENLVITSQSPLVLDEEGVNCVASSVSQFFDPKEVDILVIDPLRNVYDAGKSGSENDNMAMLAFLRDRIEKLRAQINPQMGIILTHHTKKVTKAMVEEDPFQALSGAGSLRSFYTTGMILFRADEKQSVKTLMFELRNGEAIEAKRVDKRDGTWQEMGIHSERLVRQDYGEKLDAEVRRRHDVILQLILDEGRQGKLYTPTQFRQAFENRAGLGGERTIQNRLNVLSTKGFIKFNLDGQYRVERSKYGVMCVEGMEIPVGSGTDVDAETGEVLEAMQRFLPTHFKESQSGAILPVENPDVWVYIDDTI